jgi:ribonuclease P protein component
MLPPHHRLRHSAEISRVRQQGRRWQHSLLTLYVYTQPLESASASRFAFAAGRHLGPATQRNRTRRRLREIVRRHLGQLRPGYDCLLVARSATASADHAALQGAVAQLLARGGVMDSETLASRG